MKKRTLKICGIIIILIIIVICIGYYQNLYNQTEGFSINDEFAKFNPEIIFV